MRIPLDWLGDFVELGDCDPDAISELLTLGLCEVEHVEKVDLNFEGVVVGKLLSVDPHPEAERLQLATVDDGSGETLQIVCGAPNIAVGQTVPVARIGARLPTDEPGKTFKIKKSKIRGVPSQGMLCSEKELGLGDNHEGILQLNGDLVVGIPFAKAVSGPAPVLVIDNKSLTHRPDCWGLVGLAREVGALTGVQATGYDDLGLEPVPTGQAVAVDNSESELCPRYHALRVSGLEVMASPVAWVCRLESAGIRAINNIVDATNLVLLEIGQPLHAFDERDVSLPITVRRARDGETLTTLDDIERQLDSSDLLIADSQRGLALAGVMGGLGSSVREDTTSILLEGANFEPGSIRRTSTRHGLRSESSARFEKGLTPWLVSYGLRRCVALLRETCADLRVEGDLSWSEPESRSVPVSVDAVSTRLGRDLDAHVVTNRLESLGFSCAVDGDRVDAMVPPWRSPRDIAIAEDLVEEIGRLEGFADLVPRLPKLEARPAELHPVRALERCLRRVLAHRVGANEVMTYSFITDRRMAQFGVDSTPWRLRNPMQDSRAAMRPSLLPGLLDAVAVNHRDNDELNLFEIGNIFDPAADNGHESSRRHVAGAIRAGDNGFHQARRAVEAVVVEMRLATFAIRRAVNVPVWAHPGRCAELIVPAKNKMVVGLIAEVHPSLAHDEDVSGRLVFWQLDIDLLDQSPRRELTFKSLAKFPALRRDLALVVDEAVAVEDITKCILKHHRWIRQVDLFDIYRGKGLAAGKKSLAFHLIWQDPDKTLTDEAVDKEDDKLVGALSKQGWERR